MTAAAPDRGALLVDFLNELLYVHETREMAFAAVEDLRGRFHEISRDGVLMAVEISAYTLVSLSRAALPLFTKAGGGAVMALTFNAVERVVPSYNSMAIAKAALETCVRYLAVDLGPSNVRVNAISAGPLKTLSASAVKGISTARDIMESKAPLRRNVTQEEVGNVAVFLASEWARAVTGATIAQPVTIDGPTARFDIYGTARSDYVYCTYR